MFRFERASTTTLMLAAPLFLACLLTALDSSAQTRSRSQSPQWSGIGRAATPAEIKAWDIDVRPDFKGLPAGKGSVAKGQDVWEAKCASCHGVFGESNQVFTPLTGGTTKKDIESGQAASLKNDSQPQRTMMMKLSSVSTLWDYINRAMPWNAPKTLTTEEVYAVTAYILNLAEVVPDDFTLSNQNMAEVQSKIPNRNGSTLRHGLWLPGGKPDIAARACMSNCIDIVNVTSSIPDYARDAHGNLADQNRTIGPMRGLMTAAKNANTSSNSPAKPITEFSAIKELTNKGACLSCHAPDRKIVGPGFDAVLGKYQSDAKAESYLAGKIKNGGQGIWGVVPMPPAAGLNDAEASLLARWILKGSPME